MASGQRWLVHKEPRRAFLSRLPPSDASVTRARSDAAGAPLAVHDMITYGSVCSGAGLMDEGLRRAGLGCSWMIEIDKDCREVLRRHFPGIPVHKDLRKHANYPLRPVDILAGGTPCQDLSVAGGRAGLGEKSGLFQDFIRLGDQAQIPWLLWENVRGALSVKGGIHGIQAHRPGKRVEVSRDRRRTTPVVRLASAGRSVFRSAPETPSRLRCRRSSRPTPTRNLT